MAEGMRMTLLSDDEDRHKAALHAEVEREDDQDLPERERKKKIVQAGLKRFTIAAGAEYQQRTREEEDLKFDRALPEDQWPAEIRTARAGGIGPDGFQVTERPCLVINKLDQPVQQVINEARNARLGVQIKPKSDGASQMGAEVRQGLYRTIENDSRAHIARLWALDRAVKCGRGAYRIAKKYANDGDFDIDLVIERILNQGSVYLDPFAQEPDWSDGEWALITHDIPYEEYKRLYPDSTVSGMSSEQLESLGNGSPGWVGVTADDGGKTIRVAEYFYISHEQRTLVFSEQIGKLFLDELPEGVALPPDTKMRKVDQRSVKWCLINCEEVLDEQDWEGRYIPIIPVIGKEYNVDGDRCFKGVISNSKDAQRSYNYMRSAQVEAVGLAPKAPYVMAEGQDEGYEAMWDQLNTRNYTRLKYKPIDFMGTALGPPQRNVAEPAIQAISMAVNMADQDIKSTTGRFDASLGRQRADQSGKAIMALKESGESTTSNYLENLTMVSMYHEARIILDLMPYVYDRKGRIIRILGEEENQDKTVMINQPSIPGPDGQPQAAPPPEAMQRMQMTGKQMPEPKNYDLTQGQYSVEITVGKSFATQRDENAEMLRAIMETAPGLTPMLADLLVEQIDTPIAKRAAARLKKLNPQLQDEDSPEADANKLKAQLQQLSQQNEQMQQALEAQSFELKANRYKVDADTQVRQAEIQARVQIAQINAQVGVKTTELKTETDLEIADKKIAAEIRETTSDQRHERLMAASDRQADRSAIREDRTEQRRDVLAERASKAGSEGRAHGHEVRMTEAQRQHDAEQKDRERAHGADQQERDRAFGSAEKNRERRFTRDERGRESATEQHFRRQDAADHARDRQASAIESAKERLHTTAESDKDRKQAEKDRAAAAKSNAAKKKGQP